MNFERVRLRTCVVRPYGCSKLRLCDEAAPVAHERCQDAKFDPGQAERAPSPLGDALAQVKRNVTDHEARAAIAPVAADDRLHASHQLFESEGLTDIIVGAELQARDAVADGCFGADADQRGVGFGAECLEKLGPVVVGQHEVEEADIGIPLTYELPAAVGGVCRTYRLSPAPTADP